MTREPLDNTKGPTAWVFIVGFAAAALLTLGAAVGTSLLHHKGPQKETPQLSESPVVKS
jgi:hypothetical protein